MVLVYHITNIMFFDFHSTSRKVGIYILNALFPIRCIECNCLGYRDDEYICKDCFHLLLSQFRLKPELDLGPDFNLAISLYPYNQPIILKAIKSMKFKYVWGLANILGDLLSIYIKGRYPGLIDDSPILIPVPLHASRLRQRGFNQSELLANCIAKHLCLNAGSFLVRIKNTSPQSEIHDYDKRDANVKDSFILKPAHANRIRGKKVLLVDDVVTSGATLKECAKVLKSEGASEINAITVATGG